MTGGDLPTLTADGDFSVSPHSRARAHPRVFVEDEPTGCPVLVVGLGLEVPSDVAWISGQRLRLDPHSRGTHSPSLSAATRRIGTWISVDTIAGSSLAGLAEVAGW